ncbi:extracellular solute-binding protein [Cohnella pontilimi]|uniref:Extracellular solute-binding protein n=1 Tax=Cohnella pontilimi TaxID=2564100 RepID=A0A4U0FF79_9BACL|nr:extracellular solute-binding protein [Cohnella pontilimi]TJY43501.1 extracellular solute-binding protein [Cohnella pontilimi]
MMALALAAVLLLAGCSSSKSNSSSSSPAASNNETKPADTSNGSKEKFVFWDKGEAAEAYNKLMKARVEQFGKDNNIDVEYVVVSQNDLKAKLLAAIEAKNPPDLIVANDPVAKQFIESDQLVDTSDIMNKIDFTDAAKNIAVTSDKFFMVPHSLQLNGVFLRKDIWDQHKLPIPTTWQQLYEDAKIVNDPKNGFYATGLPLGASGGNDAENMVRDVIREYGGVIIDKDNNVTVNSKETLEALKFIAKFWQEGLTPPASVTWDDNGNNKAYLAGTVGFVINSASIYDSLKKDNPDLEKKTIMVSRLGGPIGESFVATGNVFAIFKNGKGTKWAKKFITEFYEKDFYNNLIEQVGGKYVPVINGTMDTPFWKDPNNKAAGWLDMTKSIKGSGNYPGPEDDLGSKAQTMQLATKAVARIVVEKMDPQKSLDQLEQELKQLYGKK